MAGEKRRGDGERLRGGEGDLRLGGGEGDLRRLGGEGERWRLPGDGLLLFLGEASLCRLGEGLLRLRMSPFLAGGPPRPGGRLAPSPSEEDEDPESAEDDC